MHTVALERRHPFISEVSRRRKLVFCRRYLKPSDRILEVGAGDGWFARRLVERGFRVQTLDLLGPADYVGDVRDFAALGIAPHSFDVLIAFEVIEHVDLLPAARQILVPGGLLILTSPYPPADPVLKLLEWLHLCQKRGSPHDNLVDFRRLRLSPSSSGGGSA